MANRRTSISEGETIKKGLMTKSPPAYLFNKRSSWKARIFRLFKTPENKYLLRYYGSNGLYEEVKGTIDFHEIKAVALGTPGTDKIALILRTLNTNAIEAENVIFLKTAKRDFYFVDENKEEIASWFKCISEAWMEINRSPDTSGPKITHHIPLQIAGPRPRDTRPQSYPSNQPQSTDKIIEQVERDRANTEPTTSNTITSISPENSRQRSGTAQGTYEYNYRFIYNEPGATSTSNILPKVEEENPQPDNDSDDESGRGSPPYDKLPTARLKSIHISPKTIDQQESSDTTSDLNSEEYDEEDDEESVYEKMDSGVCSPDRQGVNPSPGPEGVNPSPGPEGVNPSPGPEGDTLSTLPTNPERITVLTGPGKCSVSTDTEEYNVSTDSEECNESTDSEEYNVSNNPERENVSTNPNVQSNKTSSPTNRHKPNGGYRGSQLQRTAILRLKFDPQYNSVDLENLSITVPKEHLQDYFAMQKVGDNLCVTKWKGPVEIGCLFHHGDQIDRINGYKMDSCDDFIHLLRITQASEITLTVTRNPTTAVFHMEGCNCGKS